MQEFVHNWEVIGASTATKSQITVSPRVQFAIKPDWEKEMVLEFQESISRHFTGVERCYWNGTTH
jgi:hypothetical protein